MTKSYIPLSKELLFAPNDLILLRNKNLGLRLTHNVAEAKNGGRGDMIPLSHLAGAIDIINFVSLVLEYESTKSEQTFTKLLRIYEIYSLTGQTKNTCLPFLLLSYGARCHIPDAIIKSGEETPTYLSKDEEMQLLSMHQTFQNSLENIVQKLPIFSQLLADNFNEKLAERLHLNYSEFATEYDMDYLLLHDLAQTELYKTGYDFNHYPMGKVGTRNFEADCVLKQIMFLAEDARSAIQEEKLLCRVVDNIKQLIQGANYQYYAGENDDASDENLSFWSRHWLAISLSAGAGLSAGVGLGLAMGIFNAIPTGGASILATPFAVLILGVTGFVVGLTAGIVGSLIVDGCSKSKPDDLGPIISSLTVGKNNSALFSHSFNEEMNQKEDLDNSSNMDCRQLMVGCH